MNRWLCPVLALFLFWPSDMAAQVRGQGQGQVGGQGQVRGQAAQQRDTLVQELGRLRRGPGREQVLPVPPGLGQARVLAMDSLPEASPIELLMALREPLDLTKEQLEQLKSVESRLAKDNGELLGQLMEIRRGVQQLGAAHPRDMTPQQRRLFRQQTQRATPLMRRIQENNCVAMEQVGQLLTAEQRGWMRRWLQVQTGIEPDPLSPGMGQPRGFGGGYCRSIFDGYGSFR